MRSLKIKCLMTVLAAAIASAAPATAQTSDGDASVYVSPNATVTMTHFGTCIRVTNNSNADVQYEFGSSQEWADFVAHPAPNVVHNSCGKQLCSANRHMDGGGKPLRSAIYRRK